MPVFDKVLAVIMLMCSLISFFISYQQFKERGFLFHNAYVYASKEDRNKMNKRPYYQQSAKVFFGIGIIFILNSLQVVVKKTWVFYMILVFAFILIVYAIGSAMDSSREE